MDGVVRAWVDGWVVSRGAAPPEREPWGFTVDVGLVAQVSRHVFAALGDDVDEEAVRKVADGVTGTGVWLKVFQNPEVVGAWLGEGWWVDPEPGYLMTIPLTTTQAGRTGRLPDLVAGTGTPKAEQTDAPAAGRTNGPQTRRTGTPGTGPADAPAAARMNVPDGYRMRVWSAGGARRMLVTAPDGSLAARGQVAPTGATAVFDQIETAPAHRRRGLGSVVMRTLQASAAAEGAETGVLAGTPAGRALYESLGWHVEAPLTSAKFVGPGAG
ncbi:GNAT family N-acetyltransferase [Streptomyces sp. NBC_00285]|uniref:GNAT family N-acetyltransferase n=1 Tax=Streptomyces sp. NBC_00285 TaxID=2975700 RepID=UPI002E2DBEE5|nr:GNAT family N-acetyltransferase [Streptomyces sp. NBC_00285]